MSAPALRPTERRNSMVGFARVAMQLVNEKYATLHLGGNVQVLLRPAFDRITGAQTLTLSDRPELRIDPTALLSTGGIASVAGAQVYSVEAAGTYGPLFVQGEYFWYDVDRQNFTGLPTNHFSGGYIQAALALTGETHTYNAGAAAYNGLIPTDPFSWSKGGWGAWEIAGRYSIVDLNDRLGFSTANGGVNGGKQTIYTAGLNWYVNRNVRFMFNYLHADFYKPSSTTVLTDVGAKFDAGAMRMQVAF